VIVGFYIREKRRITGTIGASLGIDNYYGVKY
jgi:hypothetical protein